MNMKKLRLSLVVACLLSVSAEAEKIGDLALLEMNLETLGNLTFTTATRVEVPFDETIGTSYIVTRDMIKKRGYQSLKDVLEHIPGFVILHRDVEYVAGARGLNSNDNIKTTLMVNGYEIAGVHEPNFLNGPINLDNVEKVEIIVGPSSFFEMASTLTATINVITKKFEGVAVSVTAGEDVKNRASFGIGEKWDEEQFLSASVTYENKKGFSAFDEKSGNVLPLSEGKDYQSATNDNYHVVLNGSYKNLTFQAQSFKSNYQNPYANGTRADEKIDSVTLKYNKKLNSDLNGFVTARVIEKGHSVNLPFTMQSRLYKGEMGVIYDLDRHTLQSGVQYSYDDYIKFSDQFVTGSSTAYGAYVRDTWQVSDSLQLIGGIRADKSEAIVDPKWFPAGQAALIYKATPDWTTKVMVNHVVKMPVAMAGRNEVWGSNNVTPAEVGQWYAKYPTATKPEQQTTYEWQNILYFDEKRGRSSITLYYQEIEDFISWGGPWSNLGDFTGSGIEGDIVYRLNESDDIWANFSWINSSFKPTAANENDAHAFSDDEGRMIGSPEFTFNMGGSFEVADDIYLSPSIRYMTKQSATNLANDKYYKINNIYYADIGFLNLNAFGVENLDIRARVKNIFNNRDYIAGSWLKGEYRPRGRTANISLEYKF